MPRGSQSRKHKLIQKVLENVIENLNLPPGWTLQHVKSEYDYDNLGFRYRVDVHAKWSHRGDKHELFIEVQNNLIEPDFIAKSKTFTNLAKREKNKDYIIIKENEVPMDVFEMEDYLKDKLSYPW